VITHSDLWQKFAHSKRYRSAFARQQFKKLVPLQVQMLRKQRGWTQEELAERSGLTQGVISRAEDHQYGNLTVNTILTIAEGFDVAFVGRFVPFSELESWYLKLSQETTHAPSFDEENEFAVEFYAREIARRPDQMSEALLHGGGRFANSLDGEVYEQMRGNELSPHFGQARTLTDELQPNQDERGTYRAAISHSTS